MIPAAEARLDALLCAFQGCIDGPEPGAERTAQFTIDGAAYYAVTPGQRTALMIVASLQASRRIWNLNAVMEDPSLPHQIISVRVPGGLAVTCNCLILPGPVPGRRGRPRQLIASRSDREAASAREVLAAWRNWHEKRGVIV
jgi:hypothetical protein